MKILSSLKKHTKTLVVLSSIVMISFQSQAGQTTVTDIVTNSKIVVNTSGYTSVSVDIHVNNDCGGNGYYDDIGNGFNTCRITVLDIGGNPQYLANVIAKFDADENRDLSAVNTTTTGHQKYEESSKYMDYVEKEMWDFSGLSEENKTGTWSYDNDFPDIRFWISKAGSGNNNDGLRLFWNIKTSDNTNNVCANESNTVDGDFNLRLECMNLAQSVTIGDWTTPNNKGLSHITFFGGLCTYDCPGPVTTPVSEPATIAILALGLLGLGVRRKKTIKTEK
ncbi:PEP-CTERM sorting domain-containing protein [Colwellia hornerae]|uniref:PEP-CTERM sorting domain-containing protein n=1 Tax=Colwellia hornerae TaxID=89402 RepID=A0A5C6Q916_9GAMM|nr:PEP-CTERM sorting domain-containing protein [Colwellia hornerae]TWX57781.1 PEP-CTERM sorting domain-containing protein [Colwellia hornerae]TWX62488.1 PEP-CTERM sorting domain-containing protein [Colwellia hornerae]TWX65047.1 PEP-CTERM sorting domain-containing protein [Colwellia hornerae]